MAKTIEKNYLLKVLTLSGVPKLITFGLTLISFPLMVRALGAENYGTLVFITASLGLLEVLMDFGVSSASGKAMAEVRTHQPRVIRRELFAWARVQMIFVAGGFIPMVFGAHLLVQGSADFQDSTILWVLAIGVCFSVVLNFLRANLLSLLAFKSLAILDTTESVMRSSGFLIVAFWVPSVIGLAVAGLVTAVLSCSIAMLLMIMQLKSYQAKDFTYSEIGNFPVSRFILRYRLRECFNFLWNRFAFRLIQEGPIIIFGRYLGVEVVGIVAAFRKIIEILSTPYLIIGNGLKVRIHEVQQQGGLNALYRLWNVATRIVTTSLFITALLYLLAKPVAYILLPESVLASTLFFVMSPLIFFSSAGGLIAPMSDYKGGLFTRNILLSVFSLIQIGVLFFVAIYMDAIWSVLVMVVLYGVMIFGYLLIAHRFILNSYTIRLKKEQALFIALLIFALLTANSLYLFLPEDTLINIDILSALFFSTIFFIGLNALKSVRKEYINSKFFDV